MSAGYRAEDQNKHSENRTGRQRVAQKRERAVSACKALRHDSGADHSGKQKCGPKSFGDGALCRRSH